jgi:phosphodiesterase/alkaline phosphatase D-like protein
MSLNRRAFLGSLLATGVSAAAATESTDSFLFREESKKGFSIMQGMTDETSAQFSLLLPTSSDWTIEVLPAGLTTSVEIVSRPYSGYAVHKLFVDGLQLGTTYQLRVKAADGAVWDEREFGALDLSPRPVRLAFLSCILDLLHRDDIWRRLETQKPEAVLFLGDNVYADRTSFINKNPADERQLWERYVLTRNRVLFYYRRRLVPVVATWDDHDFGADNAYRDFPAAEASRFTFDAFFAQSPRPSLTAGPGIARRWRAFGADFVFLDGRTFRDNAAEAGAKILGAEQERWLLDGSVAGRPTWLINGSLFFGGYQSVENFEGSYRKDFANFLTSLSASPAMYCFASGDVHFSEVMDIEPAKIGYATIELVASSVHSYTFPGHENRYSNPRRRMSSSSHNFVIFEGTFADARLEGTLICNSATREDFRTTIAVQR